MNGLIRLFRDVSLRKKLIFSYLFVIIIPIAVLGTYSYRSAKADLERQLALTAENSANRLVSELSYRLERQEYPIKSIVFNPKVVQAVAAPDKDVYELAVELIEHRLFERGYENCAILRFHEEADLVGTAREAILVFDGDRLVAGNKRGLTLLKLDWSALDKARLGDILEAVEPSADLRPIRGPDGQVLHGRLTPPAERGPRALRPAARLPAADTIEPVFDSATLAALDRAIRLVDADVPVLVHGETGAGKEVFARRVHAGSARRAAPFIAVNCAALPESLIESELFGYEEGAFTGARRQGQPGLVRQADRGILFLDEIGDMPLAAQGRLLRVLQERQVRPLGGGAPVPVDFALLCATHRPLAALVEGGSFRQDLYFRIAQYVVELPALRDLADRRGAITRLWSALGGDAIGVELGGETLDLLAAHDWPGNFRQLAGLLRAMIALAVLMSRFRFETTADTRPWPVQKLTTQPQGGLPMRVTRR